MIDRVTVAIQRRWFRLLHWLGWYPFAAVSEPIDSLGLLRRCAYCDHISVSAVEGLDHYKQQHDRWLVG